MIYLYHLAIRLYYNEELAENTSLLFASCDEHAVLVNISIHP